MSIRAIMYMTACVAVSYGFSASAATVVPYAGNVFVSQGLGFQTINGATPVKVGDAVMVSPDGLAQVHLDDGNVITVSPGQVLNVPAKARAKDAALPNGAQATADLPLTNGSPATVLPPVAPAYGEWGILPAFLLAGAGLAGAIAVTNEHARSPAIPPGAAIIPSGTPIIPSGAPTVPPGVPIFPPTPPTVPIIPITSPVSP